MTDITKLPNKWDTAIDERGTDYEQGRQSMGRACASELRQALPKWTTVTDDPDTQPKDIATLVSWVQDKSLHIHSYTSKLGLDVGDKWRPLAGLDYPPENLYRSTK